MNIWWYSSSIFDESNCDLFLTGEAADLDIDFNDLLGSLDNGLPEIDDISDEEIESPDDLVMLEGEEGSVVPKKTVMEEVSSVENSRKNIQ